jgi:hypothetical protein
MCIDQKILHLMKLAPALREQDVAIHCLSLDRARSRDKQWRQRRLRAGLQRAGTEAAGDRARSWVGWYCEERIGVIVVGGERVRRRTRQAVPRPKVVQFSLTQGEFDDVSEAAGRLGLARGAFAAEATLAAARGAGTRHTSPLREALGELVAAAGLARRIGTNLNQAVAKLNATGQRPDELLPAAEFCVRVIRRLDEAAEQVRRGIP